jgi:hypothetical protein
MPDQENHEEWDLDNIDPNDDCPDEVGEDSLGDTDYPESDSGEDDEGERDDGRKKTYRERHIGFLYHQRNSHRHCESFSGGKEEVSDSEDEDDDDDEGDYSKSGSYVKGNGIDGEDVYIGDEQPVRCSRFEDIKRTEGHWESR